MDVNSKAIDKISAGLTVIVNLAGAILVNSFTSSTMAVGALTTLTFDISSSVPY